MGLISSRRLVSLATTAVLLVPVGPWHSGTVSAGLEAGLRSELERSADGRARFATSAETGEVTFIGGSSDHPLDASSDGTPSEVARRFIDRYGTLFGVADPKGDLTELVEMHDVDAPSGNSAVRFQQRYRGVPVIAGEVAVQVDRDGSVLSTSGEALPSIDVDVNAQVSAAVAADLARDLTAKYDQIAPELLSVSAPELWIYDPSLIGADGVPGARLVWRMDVRTDLGEVDRLVLVDAHSGDIALQFSQREDALNRSVCTNGNNSALSETCSSPVQIEGGPVYGGIGATEVNSAFDLTGVTYAFYASLGRDSVDNNGLALLSTVLYCSPSPTVCPLQNAFWNGSQMVYGQGYARADDVVAHELTHGVTQYTSRLLYYAESGAINESISDVMGELVDLGSVASGPDLPGDRWLVGEQLPLGANRSMSNPPLFNDPDKMTSPLFVGGIQDAHGVHTNSGVNNKAAFLIADGGTFNGQTVVGLGLAKTARIYYQVETTLLGPGSDYLDLFHVLPQACINLIGTSGITAGDCAEVTKAVTATEMDKFPTTPGAHLAAPVCDAGTVQSSVLFNDDMESNNGNWTTTSTTPAAAWGYFTGSSQSGAKSLFAPNVGLIALSSVQSSFTVAVPPGTTTYLRFDHSFDMDYDSGSFYDGGVVEYSSDGGAIWHDAVALSGTINGYSGTLDSGFGNPLANRQAFSGPSPGYQTTRINLSTLGGSNIRLRFRLGSDNTLAYPGWFVDDVAVYTCAAPPAPAAAFNPLVPARLLESRSGQSTVDGQFNGIGVRGAGSVTALTVAGRGGVAGDAAAVVLNVTVTDAQAAGFVTVFPCGSAQPNASSLNYVAGSTVANAVIVKVGVGGQVCLFTQSAINVIADVNGYFAAGSSLASLVPARLLESRSGQSTVDGQFNGIGVRGAGSVTALTVAGRGGVGGDAAAVVLNVTVTDAQAAGFVTVFPCGSAQPNASSLNYVAGSTVANAVIVKVGVGGQVCLFTQSAINVIADVNGYFAAGSSLASLVPARLLESRSGQSTVDGQFNGIGLRGAGSVTALTVAGRGGVGGDAAAVVLNVTVTDAQAAGFVTVFPCGSAQPNASSLNYVAGSTVANAVIVKVGVGGQVCLFTQSAINVIADVNGYFQP